MKFKIRAAARLSEKKRHGEARIAPSASGRSTGRPEDVKSWLRDALWFARTESTPEIFWLAGEIGAEVTRLAIGRR
jgi:hypothetical protein